MSDTPKAKDPKDEKTSGTGFQHNQSAELVDKIRSRADKEKLSETEPNELGQQPMKSDKPAAPLTPQQQREKPREQ